MIIKLVFKIRESREEEQYSTWMRETKSEAVD